METPERTLIAVGNVGRQLLYWRSSDLGPFTKAILIARPVPGSPKLPGVTVLSYGRDSSGACREAINSVRGSGPVTLFGAAGGQSTSMALLRLARSLSDEQQVRAVVVSPFSWEGTRTQWRALYVRFRLKSTRNVLLSLVVTGRLERDFGQAASTYGFELTILEDAWRKLVS